MPISAGFGWVLGAFMTTCTGCESVPSTSTFSTAVSRYEEGRYEAALAASETLTRTSGPLAQQGALVGAMSAYKLSKFRVAEDLALRASESATAPISGSAFVLLGDIRLTQNRPSDAAAYYFAAAEKLPPDDAARARECALRAKDLAATSAPDAPQATAKTPAPRASDGYDDDEISAPIAVAPVATNKVTAASPVPAPIVTQPIAAKPPPTPALPVVGRTFTIRAGSYSSHSAAVKRAKDLSKDLQRAKAPQPRIDVIHTSKGEELFAVRIGSWPSRALAEDVLKEIARRDLMVGAVDPD